MPDEFWPHAFAYLLLNEGAVFVSDPSPTLRGITLETLSAWRKQPCTASDVRALSLSETQQIYKALYWDKMRCGQLASEAVATAVVDAAVNTGPSQATKALQATLGVVVDGQLGPITMQAANTAGADVVVQGISYRQQKFYVDLVRAKPERKIYLATWLRRAAMYLALLV